MAVNACLCVGAVAPEGPGLVMVDEKGEASLHNLAIFLFVMDAQADIQIEEIAASLGESLIQKILGEKPLNDIKASLDIGAPVWYQTSTEGTSALHAAAYVQNDRLVRLLIERGAVWNAVDHQKHTAGDIALSFNNETIYNLIRDEGIRSELILGLLRKQTVVNPSSIILQSADNSALSSSDIFLESKLKFVTDNNAQKICLLVVEGGEEVGVMMGWERIIMQHTVEALCRDHPNASPLRILNVGFGLGIIDTLFQDLETPPTEHIIIEAHPDVLQNMKENGWYTKQGVKILEGKWQDFIDLPDLSQTGGFDIVYTDTFSEDYQSLRQFFERLPNLLSDGDSRFSFFNGLGATNPLFYDVCTRISEIHLQKLGFDVDWSDIDVTAGDEERWLRSREYFSLPFYRLPMVKLRAWTD